MQEFGKLKTHTLLGKLNMTAQKLMYGADFCVTNQSINLFICFVLQNEKYINKCEKNFSKAQEGSEMTIRSSSQLPPSK